MRPALALLLLTGCVHDAAPARLPLTATIYETDRATIRAMACRQGVKDCETKSGLAFHEVSPCLIYVVPLTERTWRLWNHELRHCREGAFHE